MYPSDDDTTPTPPTARVVSCAICLLINYKICYWKEGIFDNESPKACFETNQKKL